MAVKRPRGTNDFLPEDTAKWQYIEQVMHDLCKDYGYEEIRTPIFEDTELFQRGVGDTTDIVQKEMYTFDDAGGRSITLRPENTAAAARAYIEDKLFANTQPTKLFYIGPMFRYERPQAGRFRQFHQFGVECFGTNSPAADAEIIALAWEFYRRLGLKDLEVHLNSVGCPNCRPMFQQALKDYYSAHYDELCPTCQDRLERNPLRILDCKEEHCHELAEHAPIVLDYLCDECREHFEELQERLRAMGIAFEVDPTIVRGLDYYTKTVFEFKTETIGAQGTVCGGGRYDGLVELMGGQKQPAVGFGMGLERLKLVMEACGAPMPEEPRCDIALIPLGAKASVQCSAMAADLRTDGFYAETDLMNRSLKAQLKYANKIGARYTMVIGDSELEAGKARLKDMDSGEEQEVAFDRLADVLMEKEASRLYGEIADAQFGLEELSGVLGQE